MHTSVAHFKRNQIEEAILHTLGATEVRASERRLRLKTPFGHRPALGSPQALLEAEGYRITTYTDGVSALDGFKTALRDLVILDIKMPAWTKWRRFAGCAKNPICR
jgi:hypothetical protein